MARSSPYEFKVPSRLFVAPHPRHTLGVVGVIVILVDCQHGMRSIYDGCAARPRLPD